MELIEDIIVQKEAFMHRHGVAPTVVLLPLDKFKELQAYAITNTKYEVNKQGNYIYGLWIIYSPSTDVKVV